MLYIISIVIMLFACWIHIKSNREAKVEMLLRNFSEQEKVASAIDEKKLDLNSSIVARFKDYNKLVIRSLGSRAGTKFIIALLLMMIANYAFFIVVLKIELIFIPIMSTLLSMFMIISYLVKRNKIKFSEDFPDALNIMMSALTAGESIMHAMAYVGKTLDNNIGSLFTEMSDRLKVGESSDKVFARALKEYSYPEFHFFIITLRANMSRGGQLKSVMARLIRVLVDARTIERKSNALTSEARFSAKIVALLPMAFLVILYYVSPENLEFIFYDPEGKTVLYYVLISELIGFSIIHYLIRSVR
ncbi:type II secretion system F family protein [Vibrio nomapromontoriensis]|uniref:type II secretion system F family protein n=1 Tax=Vibrio nomapromontoriensis TaxID=2910246 RepID=UPI003D1421F7